MDLVRTSQKTLLLSTTFKGPDTAFQKESDFIFKTHART
jgi:hypothetical protein